MHAAARRLCITALIVATCVLPVAADQAARVRDGVAISHELAAVLFNQIAPLREPDGCVLSSFDTRHARIVAGIAAADGRQLRFEFATDSGWSDGGRRVGAWRLAVDSDLDRDCPATIAAVEAILLDTPAPFGMVGSVAVIRLEHALLTGSLLLLVLGTGAVLLREARANPPPRSAVAALSALWLGALLLRLGLSPRTFLHEYYHVAETIAAYLAGSNPPTYGNTGPVIYRLAGLLSGRTYDVDVIFVTNALLASLAVPAIALLDLAIFGRWARALCAGLLLCLLPQHLRYSASEELFIPAVTFALWTLGLAVLWTRTGALLDVLLCALALSLAMQCRPEMMLFPVVPLLLVIATQPRRAWRLLADWRSLAAVVGLALLLFPRAVQFAQVLGDGAAPPPRFLGWRFYLDSLTLFDPDITPPALLVAIAAGAAWTLWQRPGVVVWSALTFFGYTMFSLSLYSNRPYNLRTQILPVALLLIPAAGIAPLWQAMLGAGRVATLAGSILLTGITAAGVVERLGFIGELKDQQLEWAFLRDNIDRLPDSGRLLAAVDIGGRNLNAFPGYLLRRNAKSFQTTDVRKALAGATDWPPAGDDLLFYQGMYCYFAFDDEPLPEPMSAACRSVHARYELEPLIVTTLDTTGYSWMKYAPGPYEIGFYRLSAKR